jgi:hypothetical protein
VTYLRSGQVSVTDSLAANVADAMRHTVTQQLQVYDRRTTQDRTAEAIKFTSNLTTRALQEAPAHANSSFHEDEEEEDDADTQYEVGDIVALVKSTSTLPNPDILLGKVLRANSRKREALLAHLEPVPNTRNRFRLKIGKDSWSESYDALIFPVDILYDERTHLYTLRTTPQEIHRYCLGDAN